LKSPIQTDRAFFLCLNFWGDGGIWVFIPANTISTITDDL